jgi:hypothetical protein
MRTIQNFVWDDGGRSSAGFVGLTGDCVPRAISIATGIAYRDVYHALRQTSPLSPRYGVSESVYSEYLKRRGWQHRGIDGGLVDEEKFPDGLVIIGCQKPYPSKGHLFALVDGSIRDTWDVRDDGAYVTKEVWVPGDEACVLERTSASARLPSEDLTQGEFEKIIHRLRAIDNTARNHAATDGERENALRMMQALLLRHNLSREDLSEDGKDESGAFTRRACPVNGSKALSWEKDLACYVTQHILPMTQFYTHRRGHRTWFYFYGPHWDVDNAIQLFRELLLTIATSARRLYKGYARGSGASYAEGYVASLPRSDQLSGGGEPSKGGGFSNMVAEKEMDASEHRSQMALVQHRRLIVHKQSKDWLRVECGIQLVSGYRRSRDVHDAAAENVGRIHGANHPIDLRSRPKGLPFRPDA